MVITNSTVAPTPQNGLISLFVALMSDTGKVDDAPLMSDEMMVLSRQSVNDSSAPASNAEAMSGSVI